MYKKNHHIRGAIIAALLVSATAGGLCCAPPGTGSPGTDDEPTSVTTDPQTETSDTTETSTSDTDVESTSLSPDPSDTAGSGTEGTLTSTTSSDECSTECEPGVCRNGCGGSCDCPSSEACGPDGACHDAAQCEAGCLGLGAQCGRVCGASCGLCPLDETCVAGACGEAVTCDTCPLALRLLSKQLKDGQLVRVELALELALDDEAPRPRLFDLRVRTSDGAALTQATAGEALLAAGKDLWRDSSTGQAFMTARQGEYRLLALSTSSSGIEPGRLAQLSFAVSQASSAEFSIARTEPIFTPPEADEDLQLTSYELSIEITP